MPGLRQRSFTALIPYLTIIFGLHILKNAWAAILLYHAGILFVLLKNNGIINFRRLFKGWNWKIGIPLVAISAFSGTTLYFLWTFIGIEESTLRSVLYEYGLNGFSRTIFMIYYCISTPVLEEAFWRGYLSVPGRFPSGPDFLFAGYHIIVLILFLKPLPIAGVFIALVITAWIWRITALRFNGLAIPFLSHLVAGVSVIIFINKL